MTFTKMKTIGAVVGLTALAACAVPPEGTTQQDVTSFEAAVASIGCVLRTEADYLPVELQTGLSREQSTQMAAFLISSDRAVTLEDGAVQLTTGACA